MNAQHPGPKPDERTEAPSQGALPTPSGPLSGPSRRWRRRLSENLARINESVRETVLGRLLHSRLRRHRDLNEHDITLARLPAALDGLRIAFLSDLHAGHYMTEADLTTAAHRVMEQAPDLICFGGDLVNISWRELALMDEAFSILDAPHGLWAVPGNHDHHRRGEIHRWMEYLEARDVSVLFNRGVRIERDGASFWLAGIDDLTEGQSDLNAALAGARDDEARVLLSHHPDAFRWSSEADVDLQLSGHTHGGQVSFFGWAPMSHSRHGWVHGLHRRGESQLLVGRGLGTTLLPIRIGARAEILLVRLRSESKSD
ncbi:MAG: metallophosphoesterase [Acidobacteriota bacterium]